MLRDIPQLKSVVYKSNIRIYSERNLTYDAYSETLESEKQEDDRVSVLEKQMQSLVSTLSKLTEQAQVNAVAQTLYFSGILKEGNEATDQ